MPLALSLLPLILQLIPTVETGVSGLISFVSSVRSAAQQSGDWTPALESAYLLALQATKTDPAYQPDANAS